MLAKKQRKKQDQNIADNIRLLMNRVKSLKEQPAGDKNSVKLRGCQGDITHDDLDEESDVS